MFYVFAEPTLFAFHDFYVFLLTYKIICVKMLLLLRGVVSEQPERNRRVAVETDGLAAKLRAFVASQHTDFKSGLL